MTSKLPKIKNSRSNGINALLPLLLLLLVMVLLSSVMDIVGLRVPTKQIMDYAFLMPDIQLGVAPLQTPSCLSRNTIFPEDTLSLLIPFNSL
jgi:hypothetical protein